MNPTLLLAHFNRLTDTATAIPRLHSFILDLAVHGKLLPQQADHESALNLLHRISTELAELLRNGEIRQQRDIEPIAEDELPYQLPRGWCWARLATITRRIHYGFTSSADKSLKDVRLPRITDIIHDRESFHVIVQLLELST